MTKADKDYFLMKSTPASAVVCIIISMIANWILTVPHVLLINCFFGWKKNSFEAHFATFSKVYTAITVCTIQWVHYYEHNFRKILIKCCSCCKLSLFVRLLLRTVSIIIMVVANYVTTMAVYTIMFIISKYVLGLEEQAETLEAIGWYVDCSFTIHVALPTIVAGTGVFVGKTGRVSPMVLHYFTFIMWFFGWPSLLAFTSHSYQKNSTYGLILLSMIFITIYLSNLDQTVYQSHGYVAGGNWDRIHYNLSWIGLGTIILFIVMTLICALGSYIFERDIPIGEHFLHGVNFGSALELDLWPAVITVARFYSSRLKDRNVLGIGIMAKNEENKSSHSFAAYFWIVVVLIIIFGAITTAYFAFFIEPYIIGYIILEQRGSYNDLRKDGYKRWSGALGLFIGSFVLVANAMKDVFFITDTQQAKILEEKKNLNTEKKEIENDIDVEEGVYLSSGNEIFKSVRNSTDKPDTVNSKIVLDDDEHRN